LVGLLAFFATFDLANGTKQRTFPTTVFTQQLKEKKKKKKDEANCPALWQKTISATVSDVHVCA
jgi:hypothetical protein